MTQPEHSPLGKPSAYADHYDPTLLFPLPRAPKRAEIGLTGALPFGGADLWTAYELSWLNPRGKPQVAIAHITVPADSTHIVESKSFKLYLNSFNNSAFADADAVRAALRRDLSAAIWQGGPMMASVGVKLLTPELFDREPMHELDGLNLDRLDMECSRYQPAPDLLTAAFDEQPVQETLVSNLLKSNCLVTGQPDWGSVVDALPRPADRPGRAAALHRELSQPQRIPRAVRGAHLHRPLARCKPTSWPSGRATPAAAGWTSTPSAAATRRPPAGERAHGAAMKAIGVRRAAFSPGR
jgi:7-cyano-7-deazaguanine reductase